MEGFLREYDHEMNGRQLDLVTEQAVHTINCGDVIELKKGATWSQVQIEMHNDTYYGIPLLGKPLKQLDGKRARSKVRWNHG